MITLTAPDGKNSFLEGSKVVRIMPAEPEQISDGINTSVLWVELMLVREEPAFVAAATKAELPTLIQLTAPGGASVWIDAKKATGPVRMTPTEAEGGRKSAVSFGKFRQYFRDTPEDLAAAMKAVGVAPLPIPEPPQRRTFLQTIRGWFSSPEH